MKYFTNLLIVPLICFITGLLGGIYIGTSRGIPFVMKKEEWSIGIYTGDTPFSFTPHNAIKNPVLTAKDVTDVEAESVSDPFMVKELSTWYMFFEILNMQTDHGDIGVATSRDGIKWEYGGVVLDEIFHLSYPYVFKWQNEYYMIPESYQSGSIRLYKSTDFPRKWEFVRTLLNGNYVDSSIFQYDGKWWIFTETNPNGNDTLRLYYSDNLTGPWVEHPKSPIVKENANIARPGGRVLIYDKRIFRYTQDDYPTYGNQVWAFEITELTTTSYNEKRVNKLPVLKATGKGWNGLGMHQIDPYQISEGRWIACVDGFGKQLVFSLRD